jgi:hypothetical protein
VVLGMAVGRLRHDESFGSNSIWTNYSGIRRVPIWIPRSEVSRRIGITGLVEMTGYRARQPDQKASDQKSPS